MNFEEFYRKHSKNYKKTAYRISRSKSFSEDVVQISFLKMLENQDSYDPNKGSVRTWFNSIFYNTLKRELKNRDRFVPINEDVLISREQFEKWLIIQSEADQLKNQKHGNICFLFFCQGYTAKQIAKAVGTSITNVTTVCGRFRSMLKSKYGVEV